MNGYHLIQLVRLSRRFVLVARKFSISDFRKTSDELTVGTGSLVRIMAQTPCVHAMLLTSKATPTSLFPYYNESTVIPGDTLHFFAV
jgi:hypothetical protein